MALRTVRAYIYVLHVIAAILVCIFAVKSFHTSNWHLNTIRQSTDLNPELGWIDCQNKGFDLN